MATTLEVKSVRSWEPKTFEDEAAAFDGVDDKIEFANNGNVYALVKNTSGITRTVTVETPTQFDNNLDLADRTFTIDDGEIAVIGVFTPRLYNDEDGNVVMEVDSEPASVEAMAFYR